MKDVDIKAIPYDVFEKSNVITEFKAQIVLKARKKVFNIFMDKVNTKKNDKILDAGVAPVKGIYGVKTVTNNFFERFYPFTDDITATSIEDAKNLEKVYPGLKFIKTKPYKTPFQDREFDAVFCHAVIEHTGNKKQQRAFIAEYTRISKQFFFTTPNRWFPIESHTVLPFIHWLPAKLFRSILRLIGINELSNENVLNLLTAKEFLSLFPEKTKIELIRVRTFGWTSNLIVYGEWQE